MSEHLEVDQLAVIFDSANGDVDLASTMTNMYSELKANEVKSAEISWDDLFWDDGRINCGDRIDSFCVAESELNVLALD